VRTSLNYYLGIRQVQRLAVVSVASSAVSLLAVVALTWWRGLDGWVMGRYVGEACTALVLLLPLRRVLRWRGEANPAHGYRYLVGHGAAVAASLALRTAFDQGGILALGRWGATSEMVGYFGISTLVLSVAMVFPSALGQLLVPRFAAAAHDRGAVRGELMGALRLTAAVTIPVAVGGALLCGPLLRAAIPAYAPAVPILQVLLLSIPARSLASLAGGVLLTYNRNRLTAVANAAMLAASWALFALVVPGHGGTGAAWVLLGMEHAGMLVWVGSAFRELGAGRAAPRAA